jgi:hypothetical protein
LTGGEVGCTRKNLPAAHRLSKLHGDLAVRKPVDHAGAHLHAERPRHRSGQRWVAEPAKIVNPLLTPASGLSSVRYGRMNAAKPSLVASIIRAGAA